MREERERDGERGGGFGKDIMLLHHLKTLAHAHIHATKRAALAVAIIRQNIFSK